MGGGGGGDGGRGGEGNQNLNSIPFLKCLYMSYWIVFPKLFQFQLLNFFSDLNMRCFTFNKMSSHTINHNMVEFANPFTVACIISSMRFHLKSGPWVRSGPCFSQTHSRLRFFIQGLRKKLDLVLKVKSHGNRQ